VTTSDARRRILRAVFFFVGALAVWEIAFRTIGWQTWLFPTPSTMLESLRDLVGPRTNFALQHALVISVTRLVPGFAASVIGGAILGVVMWRLEAFDSIFGGIFLGLQTLPSVCWVPLAILLLGLNETGILFVLVMGSVFAVALAFRDGLRQTPPIFTHAGRMLGAHGGRLVWHVLLPASLPALASSLRQGFSFAWRSLMGAELLLMLDRKGLGYLLHQGREFADVAQVMMIMVVMVGVGMTADRLVFATLEKRIHLRFGLDAK
jgi:NitT/TauT family transport system permease protein